MSKLKEQNLYTPTDINDKDLFWISRWVSGTEGSAGTYYSYRIKASQLRQMLKMEYMVDFTPTTVGNVNTITHSLNTRSVIVQLYDKANSYIQLIAEVKASGVNTVEITFNENPTGDVRVVIVGVQTIG
ncbi:hypothetical protein UFOVP104_5 [uncultured Caudovirales phage]|uniref:Uncharacterized protein n=1 Tax=uncultured Caudovirales phage TaxID=2100421 RepID=A0A6J5L839_9CAUD|nr:hypothetical protein UFOVP104_5 [uncultured Caudovirales phage]CAB4134289.1 hypothetical protein UFOVP271_40 [uncultured Caudovirales phage]